MTTALIGQPIDRVDGRLKVTGAARYAAEFDIPNLAHAVAFHSTIAKGKVIGFDTAEAQKVPGFIAILTHENMPKVTPLSKSDKPGQLGQLFIPMQSDEIQYAGQYLGLAIAETLDAAMHAAALVRVNYAEEKPAFWTGEAEEKTEKPKVINQTEKPDSARGDPDTALASAAITVRQSYLVPQENHNPMEMSAAIAAWNGDKLTLYSATQNIYGLRHMAAKANHLPDSSVHTIDPYVGGAFGCKGSVWPHEYLAPAAAKAIARPIKWVLTRPQMFTGCGGRPYTRQDIQLGAAADGKLTAITHHAFNHTSTSDKWAESAARLSRYLYSCPNVRTSHRLISMNAATPCQMRAPGMAPGSWALETAMDELAYACNLDPLQLRLINYSDHDEDEKKPFSSKQLKACYEQAAEKFGWSKRNPAPGSMKDGNILLGWGMATATYPAHSSSAQVRVRILNDGTARVETASHDLGTGTYTILTQIAADILGMGIASVHTELGNSLLPEAPVSGGSMTAATVGSAVKVTALKARDALLEAVAADKRSPLAGKNVSDLSLHDGRIVLTANPSTSESIADFMRRRNDPIDITAKGGGIQDKNNYASYSHGAQFAEIRIDPDLRTIRVSRIVSAFAAGKILNAKTAHSQILGGIVGGIGMALLEATRYDDRRVKIINDNLADYLVPVNADIPDIDCFFVEEEDPHINELGCKGVGELGITGIAAAITNAVHHATGKRIRELPITLDKIL